MNPASPLTCPRCGRPVEQGMNVCPNCGQPLTGTAPTAQPARASTPAVTGNQLLPALIAVSLLALVEGIVIAMLTFAAITRPVQTVTQAPTPVISTQQGGQAAPAENPPVDGQAEATLPPDNSDLPRGTIGERVESAGVAITVAAVYREPDPGLESVLDLEDDQQYLAPEVILENNTGNSLFYGSASFKLRDQEGFEYAESLDFREPALAFGTIVHGEKVRGFLSFTLPRDLTGLSLTYQSPSVPGYRTIYIDLDE